MGRPTRGYLKMMEERAGRLPSRQQPEQIAERVGVDKKPPLEYIRQQPEQIAERSPKIFPRIGLVTTLNNSGLGMIGQDLMKFLSVDSVFVVPHKIKGTILKWVENRSHFVGHNPPTLTEIQKYLNDFRPDILIFIEFPYNWAFPKLAHTLGVKVVWIPMIDSVGTPWMAKMQLFDSVRLFLSPTLYCQSILEKKGLPSIYLPWPVDTDRFQFRERNPTGRITLVHNAGYAGANLSLCRKGTDIVLRAFEKVRDKGFDLILRAQDGIKSGSLKDVDYRQGEISNAVDLYAEGDIYVATSRMEGLGIPISEAMSSGMPTVVTDSAPTNERVDFPELLVKVKSSYLKPNTNAIVAEPDEDDLVEKLMALHDMNIPLISRMLRLRIERNYSWNLWGPIWNRILEGI